MALCIKSTVWSSSQQARLLCSCKKHKTGFLVLVWLTGSGTMLSTSAIHFQCHTSATHLKAQLAEAAYMSSPNLLIMQKYSFNSIMIFQDLLQV